MNAREMMKAALDGQGCLGKADPDEPVFVLRAQDKGFPEAVRAWANIAESIGGNAAKIADARMQAMEAEHWQRRHADKVKAPD